MSEDNSKQWIQTFTGKKFFPLNPDPAQIDIRDIAHALSMICRYTGHVKRFYSVAEHSVRVSYRASTLCESAYKLGKTCNVCARWGLLHDASEAYIADVSRPVKYQSAAALSSYREIEAKLQAAIGDRFDLRPTTEPVAVKQADQEMLGVEAPRLFVGGLHPEWAKSTASGRLEGVELDLADAGGGFRLGWSPAVAERRFLKRFKELFK